MNSWIDVCTCPECGGDSKVTDSRVNNDGSVVRRRRCKECDYRWSTVEILKDVYAELKKKQGDSDAE